MLSFINESICLQLCRTDSLPPKYGPVQASKEEANVNHICVRSYMESPRLLCWIVREDDLLPSCASLPRPAQSAAREVYRRFLNASGSISLSTCSYCYIDHIDTETPIVRLFSCIHTSCFLTTRHGTQHRARSIDDTMDPACVRRSSASSSEPKNLSIVRTLR